VATTFIKCSLLFQYLRIFQTGKLRLVCIVTLVVVGLWGFTFSFMALFPCFPPKAYWNYKITNARCYAFGSINSSRHNIGEFVATYETQAGTNMALDAACLLIPSALFFRKDTKKRQIWGIVTLFVLGAV
jgi:hypothetical protein